MLDIRFLRENTGEVKKNLERRGDPHILKLLEKAILLDKEHLELMQQSQELRRQKNILNQEINEAKKKGIDPSEKLKIARSIPKKQDEIESGQKELQDQLRKTLMHIPNLLHESVPFGSDESGNTVIKEWGKKEKPSFRLKSHGELAEKRGLANFQDAARVAGKGFYYILGDLALMEHALERFAIDTLAKKGYTPVMPPLMLRTEPYEGVTDLEDFNTMMYKVQDSDLHLIATSEHPIAAMHMKKTFEEKDLPIRYSGISPCFRKEIGSHGVDEKGFFRVHHFNKIEQFVFCMPDDSWKIHEELLKNAEEIYQRLKLPYRIVSICTGDIGIVAAKKYDIEAYMPREGEYKEVVSCSNCTAYQAARLGIRYKSRGDKGYIHTLNSTAIATGRTLRAIIEQYQTEDGMIKVPSVLQKYMLDKKII